MIIPENIKDLIQRVLDGEFSEQDFASFCEWYEKAPENKIFFEQLRQERRMRQHILISDSEIERSLNELKKKVSHTQTSWRNSPFIRIAAAMLLILASALSITITTRQTTTNSDNPANASTPAQQYGIELYVEGENPIDAVAIAEKTLDLAGGHEEALKQQENISLYDNKNPHKPKAKKLNVRTRRNNRYSVVLPDGTTVRMNSGSSISFPSVFPDRERVVEMSGECYFEVAHDPHRPFRVRVAEVEVTALGTAFNINAYIDISSGIAMTLSQGKVSFCAGADELIATAGTRIEFNRSTGTIARGTVDPSLYTGWFNGRYRLENCRFDEVLAYLELWYDIRVVNESDIASGVLLSGEFDGVDPASAVESVSRNVAASYRYDPTTQTYYIE